LGWLSDPEYLIFISPNPSTTSSSEFSKK